MTGRLSATVSTAVADSPRVKQLSAMFDVPPSERATLAWDVPFPIDEQPWNVGLIVGPSGAGKTTLAMQQWPGQLAAAPDWSSGRALVDDFPTKMSIKTITEHLSAVGLASPPAWLRPYGTLSNGEKFRADMARLLAGAGEDVVVVDEFTSVVDRQVAAVASHCLQKAIRRQERRFVAVTCHYDVEGWLQPDWTLDVAAGTFTWRQVQSHPRLDMCIAPVDRAAWQMFHRHHYLSADLATSAQCFGAWIGGRLVGFIAYRHMPHPRAKNLKMVHRVVVLPDYQGLGISGRMLDWLGARLHIQGKRLRCVTAHPGMIGAFRRSPRWRGDSTSGANRFRLSSSKNPAVSRLKEGWTDPRTMNTRSFEYVSPVGTVSR